MTGVEAKIKNLQYHPTLGKELPLIPLEEWDINLAPASFLLQDESEVYAMSKWVSPKRTRSYPYARVYDTLAFKNKVTIIPIVKDEGLDGDMDYIQWDTLSLMSLLNVYVIVGYYDNASKNQEYTNKITKQQFDQSYIQTKLEELKAYHSSALHWNLREIDLCFPALVDKVVLAHQNMEQRLQVKLHPIDGIKKLNEKIQEYSLAFRDYSRQKAQQAQRRETMTNQPKEALSSETKASLTIENYLGGAYYFTADEVLIQDNSLELIESKHAKRHFLPSDNDIKDGLIKMVLFSNLEEATFLQKNYPVRPILQLTSPLIKGSVSSTAETEHLISFVEENKLKANLINKINALFCEAKQNRFEIRLLGITP